MTGPLAHTRRPESAFRQVPLPVDCTDAERFPNIARAIEHARKMREQANG